MKRWRLWLVLLAMLLVVLVLTGRIMHCHASSFTRAHCHALWDGHVH